MPQQVYMSRGAVIPPMVHAWCMHGPFVEHVCIPGHAHGLHNHPGGPGRRDAQQLPCSAATFCTAATFAVLIVLTITHTLHAQMCAERIPPSLAAQHIMNSSGGTHETRRSGSIHLCHRCHVPLPTQTPSPFVPAHSSHHARHADQPVPANACSSMTPCP